MTQACTGLYDLFFFFSPSRRILLNYAVYNPEMGYCQGMSDLVAPLLTEIQDESDTFWCFVGLMENTIFISSPRDEDMERQLVSCHWLGLKAKISDQLICSKNRII